MSSAKKIVDPVRLQAWRTFLTAHAEVVDRLGKEMEDETGLPLAWYEVLLYLRESEHGRLRMHELADSLLLSRSAVTRFVDRMEKAGYVERVRCPQDRRGTFVQMTPDGLAMLRKAAPVHLRGIQQHFARFLTTEEAELMAGVLGRIVAAQRDHDARVGLRSA